MKIAFVGDIALFGKFDLNKNKDIKNYFSDIKPILDSCDICVGNLEAPFINKSKKHGNKSAYISSSFENINILKHLNINTVCLSNNHIFDFGPNGLNETITLLEENNIDWFGVKGKDFINEELKLAFHGYCSYNTNPLGLDKKNGVNALKYSLVENKFKFYSSQGYLNILSVHSGIEHVNLCSVDDIKFARKLADINNYVYYGHHPHVLQGVEKFKNSVLAYSLGNFCFDDLYDERTSNLLIKQSDNNKSSIILILEYDGNNITMKYIPIFQGEEKMLINSSVANDIYNKANEYLKLPLSSYLRTRSAFSEEVFF
ncbi:hypothetical protein UB42_01845 [Photobacterium leiognathi]|uniref:CapA family protein n=1 Tax=Photobacterium leiognathi TaxID=553611 RepID=UPI0005D39C38|nr:CapA family protein [Photobacterium leiognathi]KJF91577.1 hypothetical protein UB42_01845 [Photobacterium leiognathi]